MDGRHEGEVCNDPGAGDETDCQGLRHIALSLDFHLNAVGVMEEDVREEVVAIFIGECAGIT
jgi:hypothetical protein